ncbi:uncharacterized protein [Nicotiana tomentosiformis]|uniref:uncharacterized protein n=1 Tax=Nicotiana tomentosiformis TaxID=4098 RepID=UPI00388C762C
MRRDVRRINCQGLSEGVIVIPAKKGGYVELKTVMADDQMQPFHLSPERITFIKVLNALRPLFIGGNFNGHIGSTAGGYGEVHGGFSFGERNVGGTSLLDFAKAFGLVILNSSFPKREGHLVTFQNAVAKTQIDYLLLRRGDRGLCKVIPGEILATQHRFLVMDIGIMLKRMKRSTRESPRIRWGALTKDKAQELEGRLSAMGAWRSSSDASTMWSVTADCIREATREVLGVSTGISGGHKGDW